MAVMYVDDSGSSKYSNHTKYFILAGVIVDDDKIRNLRKTVFEYQQSNFVESLMDAEIHMHDLYKSRGEFISINLETKIKLLNNLYDMISGIDCTGILVIINKDKLQTEKLTWTPLNRAWFCLLEKYQMFLNERSIELGHLKIDKSSSKMQDAIALTVNKFNRFENVCRQKFQIVQPTFVDSRGTYGIQIADAFAYCALKHKMNDFRFNRHWDIIYDMLWKNDSDLPENYGYKEYP